MSEKNNSSTHLHENHLDGKRNAAPGAMLVSILLLIGGLLLTSALLLDSGLANKESPFPSKHIIFSQTLKKTEEIIAYAKTKSANRAPIPSSQASTFEIKGKNILNFSFKEKDGNGVRWPRLKLSGFGKATANKTDFAIINGNRIKIGDSIRGATLIKIVDQGVELEYQGATKILTIETTY